MRSEEYCIGQTDDNRMEARILGMISAVISY
jgi:hypothetical protein